MNTVFRAYEFIPKRIKKPLLRFLLRNAFDKGDNHMKKTFNTVSKPSLLRKIQLFVLGSELDFTSSLSSMKENKKVRLYGYCGTLKWKSLSLSYKHVYFIP